MVTLKYLGLGALLLLFITFATAEKHEDPESKIVDNFARALSDCLTITDSASGK